MDNKDNKMIWHLKTAKADTPREADILHRTFMFCEKNAV